jgi:hypothetical protein
MPSFATTISNLRQRMTEPPANLETTPSTSVLIFPTAQEVEHFAGLQPALEAQGGERSYSFGVDTGEVDTGSTLQMPSTTTSTGALGGEENYATYLQQYARNYSPSVMEVNPLLLYSNPYRIERTDLEDSAFMASYASIQQMMELGVAGAPKKKMTVVEAPSREMLERVPVNVENLDLTDPRQKLATEAEALLGYTPLRTELRTPGTLKRALAKLEITVLEEKSVFAYKGQMAEHYRTTGKMPDPTWRLIALKDYKQPVPEYVLQKAVEIKRELPEAMFYVEQLAIDPFLIVTLEPLQDFMTHIHTLDRVLDPETAAYVEVWSEPKFEATM